MTNLLELSAKIAQDRGVPADTILKEILHYDILADIEAAKLNDTLVFQGGTALRLCYGGNRYSEDLDFALQKPLNGELMDRFKDIFVRNIFNRYGLETEIQEPKSKEHTAGVAVNKWAAKIIVSGRSRLPQKKVINIEIAEVPSFECDFKLISSQYSGINAKAMIMVESLREIYSDKIVALAGRGFFKARDYWDIKWLRDRQVDFDVEMVNKKAELYRISNFKEKLQDSIALFDEQKFKTEMSRFVDVHQTSMVGNQTFLSSVKNAAETSISDYLAPKDKSLDTALKDLRLPESRTRLH